jgi:beta-glucanase (GH16 family)
LAWSDEFNKDGVPNPDDWTYEKGFVRNEELRWYQADNARCENGLLVIEGRRERTLNPDYDPDSKNWKRNRKHADYTSASLTTKGLHAWQYGRFEMRGRIETRAGLSPAFWTMGIEGEWPSNGEIDIMEYYQGMLWACAMWGTEERWMPKSDIARKPIAVFNDPDWSSKFHVWRIDWDENGIKLYVDEMLLNAVNVKETFNADKERKNPFRQPHYIILGLAIGGGPRGDPSETKFPARYAMDYVRIYRKQSQNEIREQGTPRDKE